MPHHVSTPVPLTESQIGLLFAAQRAAISGVNVLQIVVQFGQARVTEAQLRKLWLQLTQHHAALRQQITPESAAEGRQIIRQKPVIDLRRVELGTSGASGLEAWCQQDRQQGIDLAAQPNWRVTLLEQADLGQRMVWSFHHASLDGNGYRLILREFAAGLEALCGERPVLSLKSAGNGFVDHCQKLALQDHSDAYAFFATHLQDVIAAPALPQMLCDQSGATGPAILHHSLSPQLSQRLRRRADAAGVRLADLCATAWAICLARVKGRSETMLGQIRDGRHLQGKARNFAGCAITMIPNRIVFDGAGLNRLMQRQRAFSLAARAHEHAPLSTVARRAGLTHTEDLFDSLYLYEPQSLAAAITDGAPFCHDWQIEERSQMALPLLLAVSDGPQILLRLEHDQAQLGTEAGQRVIDYLCRLLAAIATSDADCVLADLPMLPEAEMRTLLQLSQSGAPTAGFTDVVTAFRAAAAAQPEAIALQQIGGACLSYRALEQHAAALAARLQTQGIGPGDLVGLTLPRGPSAIIALLATLMTGAAFLHLEPSQPASLRDALLQQAKVKAVIVEKSDRLLPHPHNIAIIVATDGAYSSNAAELKTVRIAKNDRAYVVFTSGSSGTPKGVEISHGALAAHLSAITEAFGLGPHDHVLQFASLSFDVALEEIFPTLCAGARLVLRDEDMLQSLPGFWHSLEAHKISVANLPTAFFHVLSGAIAAPPAPLPAALRLLIVGGEAISVPAFQRWHAAYPQLRFLNGYGPSETTITATLYAPQPGVTHNPALALPIGRPLPHCRAYIEAMDGTLAPLGSPGGLALGGAALALGYLDHPRLTQAVFGLDPHAPETGRRAARLYRSGDRAFWQTSQPQSRAQSPAQLCFLGRADRQIKLRGYRIEPAGIEALILRHPEVSAAKVDLDHPGAAQAQLIAWVELGATLAEADQKLLQDSIHQALVAALPGHMLPRLSLIANFPKTASGKVDLSALRASTEPPAAQSRAPHASLAMGDSDTMAVCGIIARVLNLPAVGPDESFFELGGNSLVSLQLTQQLQRQFQRNLPLASLYRAQTPRRIAAELRHSAAHTHCIVPLQPKGHLPPLFVVHILGPNGAFFRPLIRRLGPEQPVLGLTLDLLDPSTPNTLAALAALYCRNINRDWPQGPVHLMGLSQGAYIAFEVAQQLQAMGREVAGLSLLDAAGPGGRPRAQAAKSLRHYAHRLRHNLPGVMAGQWARLRYEAVFQVERLRLRLSRRFEHAGIAQPSTVAAHQAAIDLAISGYQAQHYAGPLTVYRATLQHRDTAEGIASCLGWRCVAPQAQLIDTAGDHLTMLEEPHVQQFCALYSQISRSPQPLAPERQTRPPISLAPSDAVIGTAGEDCCGTVKLFCQHDPHHHMRPDHAAKTDGCIGA